MVDLVKICEERSLRARTALALEVNACLLVPLSYPPEVTKRHVIFNAKRYDLTFKNDQCACACEAI